MSYCDQSLCVVCPSCVNFFFKGQMTSPQIGVKLNDEKSFPAKIAYMLRQSECNLAGSDATSPLTMDSKVNIYHNDHHKCYLDVQIVSNILKKA